MGAAAPEIPLIETVGVEPLTGNVAVPVFVGVEGTVVGVDGTVVGVGEFTGCGPFVTGMMMGPVGGPSALTAVLAVFVKVQTRCSPAATLSDSAAPERLTPTWLRTLPEHASPVSCHPVMDCSVTV